MNHIKNTSARFIYGSIFGVIVLAGIVGLVLFNSQADTASQSTAITNASPTVDTVLVGITSGGADQSSITLVEDSTKTIYIHGAASDNNGCEDISSGTGWQVIVYMSDVENEIGCTADDNDCYAAASVNADLNSSCSGAGDLTTDYEATVALQYYADPTDAGAPNAAYNWVAYVKANDASSATDTLTNTFEVNSLAALEIDSNSISYGSVALGATSGEQSLTIINTGNRAIDLDISADGDLVCNGSGSNDIPVANVEYSLSTGFTHSTNGTDLSTSPTNLDISIAQRTDSDTQDDIYFKVLMPSTGVRGTCTNTLTLTAKNDA
jgi:hypothetical protein